MLSFILFLSCLPLKCMRGSVCTLLALADSTAFLKEFNFHFHLENTGSNISASRNCLVSKVTGGISQDANMIWDVIEIMSWNGHYLLYKDSSHK